jgi:hypothetical protein
MKGLAKLNILKCTRLRKTKIKSATPKLQEKSGPKFPLDKIGT